jgi:hypothetical protein
MTRPQHLPELPPAVRRAAQQLRDREPSGGFYDRLGDYLCEADCQAAAETAKQSHSTWFRAAKNISMFALGATAFLSAELYLESKPQIERPQMVEELELALDGDGHTWLPLTLDTRSHDATHTDVQVEFPREVRVRTSALAREGAPPSCGTHRCVHRFAHPTSADEPHLHIGVSEPGDYEITVEHASSSQRVRQVFRVAAR